MNLKFSLSLLLSVAANMAIAQPTLTALTSTPTVGLKDTLHQNTTYLPGNAGANQTWDFSGQTFSSIVPNAYEACNSTNNCGAFPGANLVDNANGSYIYYNATSTALSIQGTSVSGTNIPNSDAEDFFQFPITFGNSYTDTWQATMTNGGMTFYRSGIDSVSADGWGTLITPAGTFANTLRVKRIMTYKDSANVGGSPIIINYVTTLYSWNDVSHKDMLYSTSQIVATTGGTPSTTNTSTYTSGQVSTGPSGISNTEAATKLNLQISPNPAHDKVQVAITLEAKTTATINITDITGRVVYTSISNNLSTGNNRIEISTTNIPAGLYILRIMAGDTISASKLVIH
ncbi:T9SS type A sorting domain-containing protein [Taibaiella lutea]|uniref:T9SS type A sorting domain-containing protein n=1 Tax=Taibaiella lutea TaxID=2608001 RepID=A0A5M6CH95_9BACT|nr:T9SS type A sorting domain-containing protein [Taibaiella lutea]KAA5533302.1 T9SS type A sorting domain-containing protein [Taibaiella lutea]